MILGPKPVGRGHSNRVEEHLAKPRLPAHVTQRLHRHALAAQINEQVGDAVSTSAPTVKMCESDQDYVPLNDGLNWKGDPNATLSGQPIPQLSGANSPARTAAQSTVVEGEDYPPDENLDVVAGTDEDGRRPRVYAKRPFPYSCEG
jgi:hypothetical protein